MTPGGAFGYVHSDQVEIIFEKPIYLQHFFLRIDDKTVEKMQAQGGEIEFCYSLLDSQDQPLV
jgi:hypothetical protein